MEFDIKVQNLAIIYYLIGRSQKRLMWVIYGTRKVPNRCLPTMRYLFMTLQL
jgi:hypothetical protein